MRQQRKEQWRGIRRIWPTGWRVIVLLIVGSVMGANLIAPAVAHISSSVDHLWKDHIRPKADQRYQRIPTTAQRFSIPGTTIVDADSTGRTNPLVFSGGIFSWCTQVGGGDFYAPIHLPQGVTITRFDVDYVDDPGTPGGNGTVYITRMPLRGKEAPTRTWPPQTSRTRRLPGLTRRQQRPWQEARP